MRYILDTHIFLWWLENPQLLSKDANAIIENGQNIVYVSAAVVWEIAIKKSLGKIKTPDDDLEALILANQFLPLPITVAHAGIIEKLPPVHRDPFDRMLIVQAMQEDLIIITRDAEICKYGLPFVLG